MNILKTVKLDKKNKLLLIKENDTFKVISVKRVFFIGWRKSEYALNYQTNLTGDKIVDGDYQSFEMMTNAVKWMDYLKEQFSKRVKFIG